MSSPMASQQERDTLFKKQRSKPENKIMGLGGNGRARAFFKQHGWDDKGADKIEAKYTSRAAQLYRQTLQKEADKMDKLVYNQGSTSPKAREPLSPTSALMQEVAAQVPFKQVLDPAPVPALASDPVQAEVKPKPVRPASARTAAKKPLASKKPSSAKGKGGLGVKKMTTKVDESLFDQAPAPEALPPAIGVSSLAGAAPAQSSRFAYDTLTQGDEDHQAPRGKDGHLTIGGGSDFFSNPMGGGGSTSTSGRKKEFKPKTANEDLEGAAQKKFGNAKSISSAMFQNDNATGEDLERTSRLSQFTGATSISSADYYGRDEKAGTGMDASDMIARMSIQARQDMSNVKSIASNASKQLGALASNFMKDLQSGRYG